jgi:type IX secretion system PorP/SprF family membrane protein
MDCKYKHLITLVAMLLSFTSWGQDVHFSQFYASPLLVNPANTGNFNGILRIGGNYRDQWGSVTIPYRTFSFYIDGAIQPKKAFNRFGLGIAAFSDQAGDGNLNTTKAYVSAAYHIGYHENTRWRFAAGIAGGIVQKSVDINKLLFDSQWNDHQFEPALSNNETQVNESINYLDFGAGTIVTYLPYETQRYYLGLSAWHINQPDETFFNNTNTVGIKGTIVAGAFFSAGAVASLQPQLLVSTQKNALEIIGGMNVSFPVEVESDLPKSILAGFWYRYKDAAWFTGGAVLGNFTVSASYDMNISELSAVSGSLGGFELAIAYTLNKKEMKNTLRCPGYE